MTKAPTVYWIDEDGIDCETRCFDEQHAIRLEESLDATGLWHQRRYEDAIWHFQNAKPSIQRMPQTPARDEALQCFDRAEAALAQARKG